MTFMRKILDILNMENWEKKTQIRDNKTEPITKPTSVEQNIINSDGIKNILELESTKPKRTNMSKYDIERYAIECNAYVVREERKLKNND